MKYKEQVNNSTGETRWIPVDSAIATQPTQAREETKVGTFLADMIRNSATSQYFTEKVPEYYQDLGQTFKEKGIGHAFTPQGYAEGLTNQLKLAPHAAAAAGEIAPFLGMGLGAQKGLGLASLPKKFLPRVGTAAARGAIFPFFQGATSISPEERMAEEKGRDVDISQAAMERLIRGGIEGAGGAVVGGTIGAVTGLGDLFGGGKPKGPKKLLADLKAQEIVKLGEQRTSGLGIKKAGWDFAIEEPVVRKLHIKTMAGFDKTLSVEQLARKTSRWGDLAFSSTNTPKSGLQAKYYKALWEAGKAELQRSAPEVAKVIGWQGLSYKIPRKIGKAAWEIAKWRTGLRGLFGG